MTHIGEHPMPFANQPPVDFTRPENRQAMLEALAIVKGRLGRDCPLVIAGRAVETQERMERRNPSNLAQVVGRFSLAGKEHVAAAVAAAKDALPAWWGLGAERRADHLRRAAEEMRRRQFELSAWIMLECGKGWREATADVDEAIDFCEYYATEASKRTWSGP